MIAEEDENGQPFYDRAVTVHGALEAALAREEAIKLWRAEVVRRQRQAQALSAIWDAIRHDLEPVLSAFQKWLLAIAPAVRAWLDTWMGALASLAQRMQDWNEQIQRMQRARITAAKNRARIVTRARCLARSQRTQKGARWYARR